MLLEKMGVLQMEGVKDERCQRLVLDVEDWCWMLKIISQVSGERRSKTGAGCLGLGCQTLYIRCLTLYIRCLTL